MGFQCIALSNTFTSRNGDVTALEAVDFNVSEDQFICIVGPSGCGKTTLLTILPG